MRRVFVTGATGFVGRHLAGRLSAAGYEVRSVSREDLGDPCDGENWLRALEAAGAGSVVHLIGKTHSPDAADPSALPSYLSVNVDITGALLRACRRAGVRRFIYASSIKAVGEESDPSSSFSEESPCRPEDSYGISKRRAEELVLEEAGTVDAAIVRPPLVYGPGVKGNFHALLSAVKRGIPLPLGGVRNARSLLCAENLALGIQLLLEREGPVSGIWHLADDGAPSTPELLRLVAEAFHVPSRIFPVPPALLEGMAGLFGKGEAARKLTRSLVVSTEKAKRELGWAPPVSLREGIGAVCRWFSGRGEPGRAP